MGGDPLFPSAALLPLSDTRGGRIPMAGKPGLLRSLSATLGIVPIECGKHDTTATRWYEEDPTQKSDDAFSTGVPRSSASPEGVSVSDAVLVEYEARLGLGGVLASLDCLWLCHPHAVARAECKPLQLRALRESGLAVPRTLITNDHAAAVEWARRIGGPIVCKQLSPVVLEHDGQVRITYTTPVDLAEVDPAALAATAHCLRTRIGSTMARMRTLLDTQPGHRVLEIEGFQHPGHDRGHGAGTGGSALTIRTPRANIISSTSRKLSGNR